MLQKHPKLRHILRRQSSKSFDANHFLSSLSENLAFPCLETKISCSKEEMNPINFSDTFNGPSSTLNPPSLLKH